MRLTTLGTGAAAPDARRVNAGHLVEAGPVRLLLDCGSGVVHRMASVGADWSGVTHLALTHFDADHIGGAAVLEGRVGTALHGPPADDADARVLDGLARAGAALRAVGAGDRGTLGGASWRVLWPRKDSVAFPPGNDASVVTEFAGGGVPRALLLGDLSAAPQRALLRDTPLTRYDVVKIAHHGSADQEPALYEGLHPSAALITVGAGTLRASTSA